MSNRGPAAVLYDAADWQHVTHHSIFCCELKVHLHVYKPVSWIAQVLEVVAETEAPLLPYEELLAGAACEEPQAERAERLKAAAAAKAELAAASERVSAAALPLRAVPASQ